MEKKITLFIILLWPFIASSQTDSIFGGNLLNQLMDYSVKSVSMQEERIEESPVPVTVITQTEINRLPVRTLRDLLITLVPGFTTVQDQNEYNVAMRGVYGSSQQKILILLNGQRLNSRSYSEANPDYGISLDKIKKIEIIRGPGSSVYGNVALAGVVNIITKQSSDYNNGIAKLGIGNFFQRQASVVFGNKFANKKAFHAWASMYLSNGETFTADANTGIQKNATAQIDAFNHWPSWDIGATMQINRTNMLVSTRNAHYISPYSSAGVTGEPYQLNQYPPFMATMPGLSSTSFQTSLNHQFVFSETLTATLNPYASLHNYIGYSITNATKQQFLIPMWAEFAKGANLQIKKDYKHKTQHGNIIIGAQFDHFDVLFSHLPSGENGTIDSFAYFNQNSVLETGAEYTTSVYAQNKHFFSSKIITNLGARLDIKHRQNNQIITDISPRISLMYIPNNQLDFKISYAQSFVDAPYWYRYNSLPTYTGSENLLPEYLTSNQLTITFKKPEKKYTNTLNLFYNIYDNIVIRNPEANTQTISYINQGKITTSGIENEFLYAAHKIYIKQVITLFHTYENTISYTQGNYTANIPPVAASLNISINLFNVRSQKVWISPQIYYTSAQKSPIVHALINGAGYTNYYHTVPQKTIFHLAANYETLTNIQLKLTATNLLNTYYEQGGSVKFPYPQAGRWMNFYVGYRF